MTQIRMFSARPSTLNTRTWIQFLFFLWNAFCWLNLRVFFCVTDSENGKEQEFPRYKREGERCIGLVVCSTLENLNILKRVFKRMPQYLNWLHKENKKCSNSFITRTSNGEVVGRSFCLLIYCSVDKKLVFKSKTLHTHITIKILVAFNQI